jgi:hypothetical protein
MSQAIPKALQEALGKNILRAEMLAVLIVAGADVAEGTEVVAVLHVLVLTISGKKTPETVSTKFATTPNSCVDIFN